MSAVKTLMPAPAGALDAPRNARGAFAVPTPRTAVSPTNRGHDTESSFHSLLSQAADHKADQPVIPAKAESKLSAKDRKRGAGAASEADTRSRRNEKAKRAERRSSADDSHEVQPKDDKPTEADRSAEDSSQVDDAANASPSDDTDATTDARDDSDVADASNDTVESQANDDSPPQAADAASQSAAASAASQSDPRTVLLRQLGKLGTGAARASAADAVAAIGSPADAGADVDSSGAVRGTADVPSIRAQADKATSQLVGGPGNASGSPGAQQTMNGASRLDASGGLTAAELGLVAPAAQAQPGELARLLATAAGLADSGSPDSGAPQTGRELDPLQRLSGRQTEQTGAEGTQDRTAAASTGARATANLEGGKAASFSHLLAQSKTASSSPATNIERVAELVRSNVGTKNSSITLRLDPPELGQIQLDAKLRDDVLSIRIQAETAAARELLHSRMDDLRQALDRHGITIDRFEIEPRPASPSPNGHGANERGSSSHQQQFTDGGQPEQWQQRDPSSHSARGEGDGSVPPRDADALGELAAAGATADLSSDRIGTAASALPGTPGSSVNVWA